MAWNQSSHLWLDPNEGVNRVDDPALATVRADLEGRLLAWMVRTDDPLLGGSVPPAEGTVFNRVDQRSAGDPTTPPTRHSLGHTHRARNAAAER